MSTLITTNIKHPSSSSNNLVLTSGGGVTGAGKILQIQSTTKKDIVSTNSSSFALITGLTVSITPHLQVIRYGLCIILRLEQIQMLILD